MTGLGHWRASISASMTGALEGAGGVGGASSVASSRLVSSSAWLVDGSSSGTGATLIGGLDGPGVGVMSLVSVEESGRIESSEKSRANRPDEVLAGVGLHVADCPSACPSACVLFSSSEIKDKSSPRP